MMMKKTTRNYLGILLANALLIAFVAVIWQVRLEAATPVKPVLQGVFKHVEVHSKPKTVPDAAYLADLKKPARLADFKGKWVVLNLWATWCPSCVVELPSLQKLADAYKDKDVHVVAVSVDDAESVDDFKNMMARAKVSGIKVARNWDDTGDISNNLWPEAVPTTYFISPEGKVYATLEGDADWAGPDAKAFIDSLIKASK